MCTFTSLFGNNMEAEEVTRTALLGPLLLTKEKRLKYGCGVVYDI